MTARWIGWLTGLVLAAFAVWAARQPVVNDVTTGKTPEYPDLQPRLYPQEPKTVFRTVQSLAASRTGWRVTATDPALRILHAEADVLFTPFTDDVTIHVESLDSGSRVTVRSHSRVGRGDLGVNARRIRALMRDLDVELQFHHRDTVW